MIVLGWGGLAWGVACYMAVPTVHLRGLEALTVAPPRWLRVLQIPLGVSKYMDTLSRSSKYEHAVASHPGKRRQVLLCGYVKVCV